MIWSLNVSIDSDNAIGKWIMLQKKANTEASLAKSVGAGSVAEHPVFALLQVDVALGTILGLYKHPLGQ